MLDAVHAGLLAAMLREGTGCSSSELRDVVRTADVERIGRLGGRQVVLASVHGPCACGNVNCPYYVMRGGDVLLSTDGYSVQRRAGAPLPLLVVLAHDSALVSDETTFAYRNGRYLEARSVMVRGTDGARKPVTTAIRFAPGTSSAGVRGAVSLGWDDEYTFVANAGQQVTLTARPSAPLTMSLAAESGGSTAVRSGMPLRLRAGGRYTVLVETGAEREVSYSLQLTIVTASRSAQTPRHGSAGR